MACSILILGKITNLIEIFNGSLSLKSFFTWMKPNIFNRNYFILFVIFSSLIQRMVDQEYEKGEL